MGLNWRQFELGVLRDVGSNWTEVTVRLIGETLWHESDRLHALGQYPHPADDMGQDSVQVFGPGLGIASIERETWNWMRGTPEGSQVLMGCWYESLTWDLRLNVVACRLRYKLDPSPLPLLAGGIEARADYWWKVYNRGKVDRRPDYIRNARAILWA